MPMGYLYNAVLMALMLGSFLFADLFGMQDVMAAESVPHGEAEHAEGGHGENTPGLPQLDASTYPSQLFWLAMTFTALYLIFSKKTLPDMSSVIENRRGHVDSNLDTAEKLKKEADEVRELYEKNLAKARSESTQTLADMQSEMRAKSEKQTQAFLKQADKDIAAMEKNIQKAQNSAKEDMESIAAEIASEAAGKIVGLNTDVEQARDVIRTLNNGKAKAA